MFDSNFDSSYLVDNSREQGSNKHATTEDLLSVLQHRTDDVLYPRKMPSESASQQQQQQQQGSRESAQEAWNSWPTSMKQLFYPDYFTVEDRMLLLTSYQFLGVVLDLWLRRNVDLGYPMDVHEAILRRNGAFFWCSVVASEVDARGYHALASSKSGQQYTERVYTFKRIKGDTKFRDGGTFLDKTPRVTRECLLPETIDDYLILHVLYSQADQSQFAAAMDELCPDILGAAYTTDQCKEKPLWKLVDMRFQWCDLFDVSDD